MGGFKNIDKRKSSLYRAHNNLFFTFDEDDLLFLFSGPTHTPMLSFVRRTVRLEGASTGAAVWVPVTVKKFSVHLLQAPEFFI